MGKYTGLGYKLKGQVKKGKWRNRGVIHLVGAKEDSIRIFWTTDTRLPASTFQTEQDFTEDEDD